MKVQSSVFRSMLIAGLLVLLSISTMQSLSSCQKDTQSLPPVPKDSTDNVTAAQKAFDMLVLGKAFYMKKGIDSAGNDLTSQYADQIYILQKETYENGPLTVTVGGVTYNGTWKANTDYSKLELTVTGRPDFAFYSIPWRVKNKTLTGLSMVPQDAANAGAKAMDLEKK